MEKLLKSPATPFVFAGLVIAGYLEPFSSVDFRFHGGFYIFFWLTPVFPLVLVTLRFFLPKPAPEWLVVTIVIILFLLGLPILAYSYYPETRSDISHPMPFDALDDRCRDRFPFFRDPLRDHVAGLR